jgi:hypothetical protein
MRLDSQIERNVEEELQREPDVDVTDIAVGANGVVTLTGFLRRYSDKCEAEKRLVIVVTSLLNVALSPRPPAAPHMGPCSQGRDDGY